MAQFTDTGFTGSLEIRTDGFFKLGTVPNTGSAGNMWFDTTTNEIKVALASQTVTTGGAGSWTTTASRINVYTASGAGGETGDASMAIGGCNPAVQADVETFDGTSWTAISDLITARVRAGGAGSVNAILAVNGSTPSDTCITEEYNGSSWSSGASTTHFHQAQYMGAGGTQNAALASGGGGFNASTCTEEYNGTSWSTGGAQITAINAADTGGSQIGAFQAGGFRGPTHYLSETEEYNGSTWSTGPNITYGAERIGASGTLTVGLVQGGYLSGGNNTSNTNTYDGTSWSSASSLNNSTIGSQGAGDGVNSLSIGRYPSRGGTLCTEIWELPTTTFTPVLSGSFS